MSVVLYYSNRDFEESETPELVARVVNNSDALRCEVGVLTHCAPVGYYLDEFEHNSGQTYEEMVWAPTAIIRADNDDLPLLACEDCVGWLEEAFSQKIEYI